MMIRILSLVGVLSGLFAFSAFAAEKETQGFVNIGRAEPLYVDYYQVDNPSTTLVILNGLTYDTTNWDQMMPYLRGHGFNILRYDMRGQGRTLQNHGPEQNIISIQDQIDDLNALLASYGLGKVDVLGLSYGGGLGFAFAAQHPEHIITLIAMSPYVGPDTTSTTALMLQNEVNGAKLMNPLLSSMYTDTQLYQYYFGLYYYSSAGLAEPVLLTTPNLLQSTFNMTEGLWTDQASIATAQAPQTVHYIIADQDQYQSMALYDSFWNLLPNSAKASRININGTQHKIPESIPAYAAAWVNLILARDPQISGGATFNGDAASGTAVSNSSSIQLPKAQ